jgi:hypothetical protein
MSPKKKAQKAAALAVNAKGVEASVTDEGLSKFGQAVRWLAPRKSAKAEITSAFTKRVTKKIGAGKVLDELEQHFLGMVFDREAARIANQVAVAERTHEVIAPVKESIRLLPAPSVPPTVPRTDTFFDRARQLSEGVSDEAVQDLFARLLAGEVARPGTFSPRTLETVSCIDGYIAGHFDRLRRVVFNASFSLMDPPLRTYVLEKVLSRDAHLELADAGLTDGVEVSYVLVADDPSTDLVEDLSCGGQRLRITAPASASLRISFDAIRLTRAGRELASVLPPSCDDEYFSLAREIIKTRLVQRQAGELSELRWTTTGWVPIEAS